MSKKSQEIKIQPIPIEIIPGECPFREFRDSELITELWGLNPPAYRAALHSSGKSPAKYQADQIWVDKQAQPLPRSVRHYLHGWVKAEELALDRWDAELVVFEENDVGKMSVIDFQLSHAQVLLRSSFCRRVLSACYILERMESFVVEHQWENFTCVIGAEGWRAKYHIYSPGVKAGGGPQHRPGLSRNGCYLVRLFYLGAWRCVWVNDLVPVDATDSPLLPFSPLMSPLPNKMASKQAPPKVTAANVHLWPLLLCKALLKLAAPDMNCDDNDHKIEDETLPEFDLMHALTGTLNLTYKNLDNDVLWNIMTSEVVMFSWDEDDETQASTVKSKSTKKIAAKDLAVAKRGSAVTIVIADTQHLEPYVLPGVTPCHETELLVTMARDVPLKKPLPEPDVPHWKEYRWIDWARRHGLYEAFDCPRTRFIKVSGLMKMSYAPHLLDVQSSDSITYTFRLAQEKNVPTKSTKSTKESTKHTEENEMLEQMKEELREWVLYEEAKELLTTLNIFFLPSMYQYTSAASNPPIRITKAPTNRAHDMVAPKNAPLYLQIDGPDVVNLKIALSVIHPRVLSNCGDPMMEYVEPGYVFLEEFEWYKDCALPVAKTFVQAREYNSVEVEFLPGRHICRLWVHSPMHWHVMLLSKSNLLLGTRDLVLGAAVRECPWASIFLSNLGTAFSNWMRSNRSGSNAITVDREFFKYYQPDLDWDPEVVGYSKSLLHWMFRRALESLLIKKLGFTDFRTVCTILRHNFCDPEFGLPPKPPLPKSLRDIIDRDPCDCVCPEEVNEEMEEEIEQTQSGIDKDKITALTKDLNLVTSQICDLATEDLSCGLLKNEREKVLIQHDAATLLQAHWRGAFARKCLNTQYFVTPEAMKLLMDNVFGSLEGLSALMNEFFKLYPGVKYAYSLASALTGTYGLQQYSGTTRVTPNCTWIPFFQGIFYCHGPVKVHFDLQTTLGNQVLLVYDNDTQKQMPQVYNAHVTFNFTQNSNGYTVMGNGSLKEAPGTASDVNWVLTVLSSVDNLFHVCDCNDAEYCNVVPLASVKKLRVAEMFIPNRRNILGGVQLTVFKDEIVRFRAQASSQELELIATLKSKCPDGDYKVIEKCASKGELYWPYIRLKCEPPSFSRQSQYSHSHSHSNLKTPSVREPSLTTRNKQNKILKPASARNKSALRLKDTRLAPENKNYLIEITTPNGWPLSLTQWKRVDEVRYAYEMRISHPQKPKATFKEKPTSAKDKDKKEEPEDPFAPQPHPDDAFIILECSLSVGAVARRDDERDLEFAMVTKAWDAKEPGRNNRGAHLRQSFRTEFLHSQAPPPAESVKEEMIGEEMVPEEETKEIVQGPTPASQVSMVEMEMESEEEILYLTKPDQLKDKFNALDFLNLCMKEKTEESVLLTPEKANDAKVTRSGVIEASQKRMMDLQLFNELKVLGRQKKRSQLLEKLAIDATWSPELQEVLEARDEAIAQQVIRRNLSIQKAAAAAAQAKKKPETKKK